MPRMVSKPSLWYGYIDTNMDENIICYNKVIEIKRDWIKHTKFVFDKNVAKHRAYTCVPLFHDLALNKD